MLILYEQLIANHPYERDLLPFVVKFGQNWVTFENE